MPRGAASEGVPQGGIAVAELIRTTRGRPPKSIAPGMTSVLVIDDDPQLLDVVAALLGSLGYEPRTACGGVEGVESFRAEPTPIVVTDLRMPDKEGAETIRDLRDIRPDVRILAISGAIAEACELGADDVLAKPFTRRQLADSMSALEAA